MIGDRIIARWFSLSDHDAVIFASKLAPVLIIL